VLFFFIKDDYKTVGLEKAVDRTQAEKEPGSVTQRMSKRDIVRAFAGTPSLLMTYFGFAGMMFTSISMSTFLPTYFQRVQGFPLQKATLLASGIMLTSIIGSPLGGWIADTWMKKHIRARLLVPSISAFLAAALFLGGFHFFSEGILQCGIFLLAGIASIAWALQP